MLDTGLSPPVIRFVAAAACAALQLRLSPAEYREFLETVATVLTEDHDLPISARRLGEGIEGLQGITGASLELINDVLPNMQASKEAQGAAPSQDSQGSGTAREERCSDPQPNHRHQ